MWRRRRDTYAEANNRDGRAERVVSADEPVTMTRREERVPSEYGGDAIVREERRTHADVPPYDGAVTREDVVEETATPAFREDLVTEQSGGTRFYDSLPARVNSVLGAVLLAIEALIGLRFALLAFGASTRSSFVSFIMDVSWPFVRPFSNAFTNRTWDQGLIELNSLLAAGVWLLGFTILMMIVNAVLPHDTYDGGTRYQRRRVTHV